MKQATLPIFPEPNIELMQGDCLELMSSIPDGSVDMVMADPPYGTTACKWDSIIPLEPMWEHLKRVIKKNGAIVLTASQPFTTTLISSNMGMFKYCWYWKKSKATNYHHSPNMPLKIMEDAIVFSHAPIGHVVQLGNKRMEYTPLGITEGKTIIKQRPDLSDLKLYRKSHKRYSSEGYRCKNENYPTVLLEIKSASNTVHPTQKPVALMEYLIKTYTNESETVLDFCMGSGTTGVACRNLNRDFIGIEKDPECFKIAEERVKP